MDLQISNLCTLAPEGPCCVFYATRHDVYWDLTYCSFLQIPWFDITHTNTYMQRHTTHSVANILTYQHIKYISTSHVMCSQQLYVLYSMNNSLISKSYFPQCPFFSKITHVQKSYIWWFDASFPYEK